MKTRPKIVIHNHYTKSTRDEEGFKVGQKVHLGFGAKGGAGFNGTITKIDESSVEIKNDQGRVFKGPVKFLSPA